jgi:hypothetical protein
MSTSTWARSRTVRPVSSATPYSVITTAVWWRGVETTAPGGPAGDARHDLSLTLNRGTQADERVGVEVQLRFGHGVLVAADTRNLPPVDAVGHHLAVEIDREGTVDRHEVGVLRDDRGVVDRVDRQEGHLFVPVQPLVELGDAEGEGRLTSTPSNNPLASLVTLPAWCRRIRPVVNISE